MILTGDIGIIIKPKGRPDSTAIKFGIVNAPKEIFDNR